MGLLAAHIDSALEAQGTNVVVVASGTALTGLELRNRIRILADNLRTSGVPRGAIVGLTTDRSVETVVSILGILHAGCAYLPVDQAAPDRWRQNLLSLSGVGAVLLGGKVTRTSVADSEVSLKHSRELAYVMGTSGTTGHPKGVAISSDSLLHYCKAFARFVGGSDTLRALRMASATTLAADLGNTMLFPALLFGGEFHLMSHEVARDPRIFSAYMTDNRIDALKTVPTHLRAMLDHGGNILPRKLLVVGGETFGLDLLRHLETRGPSCAVFNHYGPTETTIGVAMHRVATDPGSADRLHSEGFRSVPVGMPLGETQFAVLDDGGHPCSVDEEGELVIEGPQVAEGYLTAPGGQATSFAGTYRSGDRARRRCDGLIELRGRIDRQLKVRGHRVEAVEVEEQLRACPDVVDAAVAISAHPGPDAMLVAWLHTRVDLEDAELHDFLAARLPAAAIPARFIRVEELPRTSNGKIDFARLPSLKIHDVPAELATSGEEAAKRVFSRVLVLPLERAAGDFFRLGGNSLAALRAVALLRAEYGFDIGIAEFYAGPTPEAIGRAVRAAGSMGESKANCVGQVSAQLLALWTHLRAVPNDETYKVPLSLRITGDVGATEIEAALRAFIARHPALRTRIEAREGKPFPMLDPDARTTFRLLNATEAEERAGSLSLEHGPVVEARVTRTGAREHFLYLLIHHAVWDGASGAVLVRELAALLANAPLSRSLEGAAYLQPSDWEPRQLGPGVRAMLGLPATRPGLSKASAGIYVRDISGEIWKKVEARASNLGTTSFAMAVAAWALVLSRQDGEAAITIGTPADLRDAIQDANLVGYHTNIAVLEVELDGADRVGALVRQAHRSVARAIADRYRPYSTLVAEQRAATDTPPARTLLSLERLEVVRNGIVEIEQTAVAVPRSVLDLDLGVLLSKDCARIHLHFRSDVCPKDRAHSLADQFVHTLGVVSGDPEALLADLDPTPAEWASRVRDWSRGPTPPFPARWSCDAVAVHALDDPGATALVWPGGYWSRAEFADEVRTLTQKLRAARLGPGHVVAITMPPSPALAVAWNAAYIAGAAVLGLDPSWPKARRDAAVRLAMAEVELTTSDGVKIECSGTAATARHVPELAYMVLTSGSTGAPKLVAVQRSALANELSWFGSTFPLDGDDCVLAHSSPGFDVCVWDMLGPLSWGARLAFPALHRRHDVPHLATVIRDCAVTAFQSAPALIDALTRELEPGGLALRLVVSGGEELSPALACAVLARFPKVELVNTYGPSETAIDVVFHRVVSAPPPSATIPLGRPIAGTAIYILDESLRLLPPGVFGQIAIGGAAVGLGYVGEPAEMARRFLRDPFDHSPGSRIYLTGDRARWNGAGILEYGGRRDHQVKVRGNRVELQAVEAALKSLPTIEDAVVHLQYPGTMQSRLAALIVPRGREVEVEDIYQGIVQVLPGYMVPSVFGIVTNLPRLSNGKVARDAAALASYQYTAPVSQSWKDETEAQVASVWATVLKRQELTRHLPFFASGGTSLLVPILQTHLVRAFGEALTVPDLFEHCTIAAQAALLRNRTAAAPSPTLAASGRGSLRRAAYAARQGKS